MKSSFKNENKKRHFTYLQSLNLLLGGFFMGWNTRRFNANDIIFPVSEQNPQQQQQESAAGAIEFPSSVKNIIINIGSNLDPIMPHPSLGPCARTIAVEPIVGCRIRSHPQLDVAASPAVSTMKVYSFHGVSCSLANPTSSDKLYGSDFHHRDLYIYLLKLRNLLIFRLHQSGITMKYHHQLSGLRAPSYMSPP
jgi:hypothetical protein